MFRRGSGKIKALALKCKYSNGKAEIPKVQERNSKGKRVWETQRAARAEREYYGNRKLGNAKENERRSDSQKGREQDGARARRGKSHMGREPHGARAKRGESKTRREQDGARARRGESKTG